MQTGLGAAGSRDDGNVGAPGEPFRPYHIELRAYLANPNFALAASEFSILRARDGTRRSAGTVVHGHGEMECHAEPAIGQILDTNNLAHVFAVHGIVRGSEREGHENAHALIIICASGVKINPFF